MTDEKVEYLETQMMIESCRICIRVPEQQKRDGKRIVQSFNESYALNVAHQKAARAYLEACIKVQKELDKLVGVSENTGARR